MILSIVIPVLNEAQVVPLLLHASARLSSRSDVGSHFRGRWQHGCDAKHSGARGAER